MSAHDDGPSISRRSLLAVGAGLGLLGGINGIPANAADDKSVIKLKVGLKQLNKLLKDWDEVTTLCNFAEVPRELLETQNKAKLLEKAKVNALFDKEGAMVVKCKRNPVPVRAAMGFNEDPGQPLFRADKTIKQARAKVDPDFLEDYIELEERWSQLQSSIDSMSYGSAMRGSALGDFKQGEPEPEQAKFLESERREITKARDILQVRPLCANRRDFKHSTRARAAVLYVRKVCGIRRVWAVREELPEREEGAPRHAPAAARAVLRGVEEGSRRSWEPWMDSLLPDPA